MCLNSTMVPVMAEDNLEEPTITNSEEIEVADLETLLEELSLINIEDIKEEDLEAIGEKITKSEEIINSLDEESLLLYDLSHYYEVKDYIENYTKEEIIEEPEEEQPIIEDEEINNDELIDINNNVDENDIIIMSDEEREELSEKLSDIPLNYIPDTYPKEGLLHKKKKFPGLLQTENETIPASYSSKALGYISTAKLQNPYGTCWAFAAVAAAEANYAKNHNKQLIDLSELHLSNYTYITGLCEDPLDLISEDGFIYGEVNGNTFVPSDYDDPFDNPDDNRLQLGGNQTIAEQVIGSGVGFVSEANMPYPTDHYPDDGDAPYDLDLKDIDYGYHTDYILKETNVFSMSEPNEIKKAIMKYGALTVSYLHRPNTAEDRQDDWIGYYGKDGKSYMGSVDSTEDSNHAVTLIGWDDNYAVSHFGWKSGYPVPQNKGAWLVKNSWDTDFGDQGCFYISYEDGSIVNSEAFAYTIEAVGNDTYDIYQYDGAGLTGGFELGTNTIYEGAIYTAQKNEILDSIGITLMDTGVTYEVYVYNNLQDDTDPTSGDLVYSKVGSSPIANAGYHTIPIDQEIKLASGDKFSVIAKLSNPNESLITIPTDVYSEPLWGCIEINNKEAANQTFIGMSLDDMFDAYDDNPDNSATMKIKAICKEDPSTTYTVEHYFQNIDNDDYTIDTNKTQIINSIVGTSVTAQALTEAGFTYVNASPSIKTGTVLKDGALVLKLYYKRNKYTVTFKGNSGTFGGVATKTFTEKYGKEITIPTPERYSYELTGWSPALEGDTMTIPATNITYTAQWTFITPTHTISFNKNGHAESSYLPDPYVVNDGDPLDGYYLPTLYDENYWFVGWDQLLPEKMPTHDIVLNAIWVERKDVPQDLSVSLDSNDVIVISTTDEEYLDALMSYYDYRYNGENPVVDVKQGKYLKNDNTTENASKTYSNRVYYESNTPDYSNDFERIDSTHVKVSSYNAKNLSNGETDITVIAKGYKAYDTSITFTKLVPTLPNDVTYSFTNGVLTVNSSNKTWLKSLKSVLLTETDDSDYDQDISIPRYIYEDDIYYINYVDDHLEVRIPKIINKYDGTQQILKDHNYRVILSPQEWFNYGYESIYISNSDKVIESLSFDSLISAVSWTFKCANNKFYIESTNDEWLDELVNGEIGIIFYPSNTKYYSIKIKNDINYQPIKKENGCITISDVDLKQCGIYKGSYNAIYFDTLDGYNYPSIYNTYQKTYNTYSWQGFKLTYGKALEKMPTVSLSEGDNGSLNIYSSNEQYLKNIMYVFAVCNNMDSYGTYTYYPYDISDNTDNVENHISNNTLNIPDMGFENGNYSFAIGSYGFVADNIYFTNQLPYNVEFENIELLDLPADVDIVKEGNNYYLTSNTTAYIDAYDTMNTNVLTQREYYKYSPKNILVYGAGLSGGHFIEDSYYSQKISSTKATIGSVSPVRTKVSVKVPGYKTLTKLLGDKQYIVHNLDGIKVKTVDKKVYLYPGDSSKLENLINKINYDVAAYSTIGWIRYGDSEELYYDSKNWDDGYIERGDLSTGTDAIGPYLCIDLRDRKFFSNSLYTKEPFFIDITLESSIEDYTCSSILFCINRDQYCINYHDDTHNTFMSNTDFPFYYVGKDVTLVDPYNGTYAFDGWYTKDGINGDWGEKVTSITKLNAASLVDEKADINLYAKWFTTEKNILSGVTANIESGEVVKGTTLVLSTSEPSAEIRYTNDGSTAPSSTSTLYSEPIIITEEVTIKANVFEEGKTSPSTPITLTFTIAAEQDDTQGEQDQTDYLWTSPLEDLTFDPSVKQYTQTNLRVYHYKTLLTEGKDYTVKYANNKKAGTATLTITGKGNYAGSLTKTFDIARAGFTNSNIVITLNKNLFTKNGKPQKPTIKSVEYINSTDGKVYKLKNNTDYMVTIPSNAIESGNYNVTILGNPNGNYQGMIQTPYEITDNILASTFSISGLKSSYSYNNGNEVKPDELGTIVVKSGKTILEKDIDYEISYDANTEVGIASIDFTGIGEYEGTITKTFKITGTALSSCKITGFVASVPYKLEGNHVIEQEITLTDKTGNELVKDEDYEITYEKNDTVGTATMIITGKKGYTGTIKKAFKITGTALSSCKLEGFEASKQYNLNGDHSTTQTISFTDKAGNMIDSSKYEITYQNNTKVGTATMIVTGKLDYTGTIKKTFKITGLTFNAKTISILGIDAAYDYTESEIKPTATLTSVAGGNPLIKDTDYEVTYKNNINVGTATITYKGIGQYTGSFTVKFKINKLSLLRENFESLNDNQEVEYLKGGVKPAITSSLVLNKDYTIKYTNNTVLNDNTNPKKITSVVLTGKGNYQGTVTIPFKIVNKNINKVSITAPDKVYAFKVNAYKSTPTLIDSDGKKLVAGTDYDKNITYRYRYDTLVEVYDSKTKSYSTKLRSENELVGPNDIVPGNTVIKMTVNGTKNYTGSITTVYKVGWIDISKATVTIPAQYYSGKPICPTQDEIIVKIGKDIIDSSNYYISSYSNNTAKGSASLTIKGKGDICGEKTVKFTISTMNFGNVIRFYPNADGVTGTMKDQIITKDTKLTKNSFKLSGKTFIGWSTDPGATSADYINNELYAFSINDSGKLIKLYAIWQ